MGMHTPLRMSNSVGVIDAGYSGSVKLVLDNTSKYIYTVEPGTRLCQIVSPDMRPMVVNVVDNIENPSSRKARGIGSTGLSRVAVPPCLEKTEAGVTGGGHRENSTGAACLQRRA